MVQTTTKIKNNNMIELDQSVMDLLSLHVGTSIQITTDGNAITITPIDPEELPQELSREEKLQEALAESHTKYSNLYKRLAE